MTVKECVNNLAGGLDWKVVCNGFTLVTNKSCAFTDKDKLKKIEQKEVITCVSGLNDVTIVT